LEYDIELIEFMDQVDFCLSLRFKEKWRHKYSSHFIRVFQEKVLKSLDTQKPVKKSSLYTTYTKKYKYSPEVVFDFFKSIEIGLYYPIVYDDSKFLALRAEYNKNKD